MINIRERFLMQVLIIFLKFLRLHLSEKRFSHLMQIEVKGQSSREKKLIQLETLLNFEIPVSGTLILVWWLLPGEILFLFFIGVIVLLAAFTITMAVFLFQLNKYGWFSALMFFVVVPLCLVPFYSDGSATYPIYYVYPLAFFAFYSITLRVVVPTWDD